MGKKFTKKKEVVTAALLAAFVATAGSAFAETISVTNSENVAGRVIAHETGQGAVVSIGNSAVATVDGELTVNLTAQGGNGEPLGIDASGGSIASVGTVNVNINPVGEGVTYRAKGIIVRGASESTIDTANVTIVAANEAKTAMPPDSNATYGIAVGYNFAGGAADAAAKLTVREANITVVNTPKTILNEMSRSKNMPLFGNQRATFEFEQQLSGLKVYRTGGAVPTFESTENLNIVVEDKSEAKVGRYLAGIYISGDDSKAILNNSNITVKANGKNSAAIKIGRGNDNITGNGATVESKGAMTINTAEMLESAAIRLFDKNSKLLANFENSSADITSADSVVSFDITDYVGSADLATFVFTGKTDPSRNVNGDHQEVRLKNAVLKTTSETASLVKVRAQNINNIAVSGANLLGVDTGGMNNGSFASTNAVFELSGVNSIAKAPANGWLVEAEAGTGAASSINVTINDRATVEGLMHKATAETSSARLDVALDTEAVWKLAPKGDGAEHRATLSSLSLANGAILDAATNKNDGNKTNYFVKLTSDGTANDGKLVNDGIISMANNSVEDVLTIEGNYEGKANSKLLLNVLWNSPGDDVDGIDSTVDRLEIMGDVTGTTVIGAISLGNKENVIDGTIGSISQDLRSNTLPVVRVHGAATVDSFTGEASTTGAGKLKIAFREKDGKREFYWTLTAVNNDSVTLIDSAVPGYVQTSKINEALGHTSLATLHERRGDHQIIKWDNHQARMDDEDQIWARYIKTYHTVDGDTRFGYDMRVDGLQVGNDFKIQYDDKQGYRVSGAYFTFLRANTVFFDEMKTDAHAMISADKFTGIGRTQLFALGATTTKYKADGTYLDLVGQVSYTRNKYNSEDGTMAKNNAWGFALSAEAGKPYVMSQSAHKKWVLEPQAQLVYQHVNLKDFNDGVRVVSQDAVNSLRGRLGVRLAFNEYKENMTEHTKVFYAVFNLWKDFKGSYTTHVGKDVMTEKYATLLGEFGLGAQVAVNDNTYVYGDFRYERNLGGSDYEGYKGTLGVKYIF